MADAGKATTDAPTGAATGNALYAFDAWMWRNVDLRRTTSARWLCGLSPRGAAMMVWAWRALIFCYAFSTASEAWGGGGQGGCVGASV
jgi:hypothetical protein